MMLKLGRISGGRSKQAPGVSGAAPQYAAPEYGSEQQWDPFKQRIEAEKQTGIVYSLYDKAWITEQNRSAGIWDWDAPQLVPKFAAEIITSSEEYGEGQSGIVRPILRIDEKFPIERLVAKDWTHLVDDSHNYACTKDLLLEQQKIRRALVDLRLESVGGSQFLMGMPVGLWKAKRYRGNDPRNLYEASGYVALDLKLRDYLELDQYYNAHDPRPRNRLLKIMPRRRIYMAMSLSGLLHAFASLSPRFAHGDIQPNNIMINGSSDGNLALIDYDDGVFCTGPDSNPRTYGNSDFVCWQDPINRIHLESGASESSRPNLGVYVDWWALAVTTHFLIFGHEPYFFVDARIDKYDDYAKTKQWPNTTPAFGCRDKAEYSEYMKQVEELKKLAPDLFELFFSAFTVGRLTPSDRPSPFKWYYALKQYRQSLVKKPEVNVVVPHLVLLNRSDQARGATTTTQLEQDMRLAQLTYKITQNDETPATGVELWELAAPPDNREDDSAAPSPLSGDRRVWWRPLEPDQLLGTTPFVKAPRSGWFCLAIHSKDAGSIYRKTGPFKVIDAPAVSITAVEVSRFETSHVNRQRIRSPWRSVHVQNGKTFTSAQHLSVRLFGILCPVRFVIKVVHANRVKLPNRIPRYFIAVRLRSYVMYCGKRIMFARVADPLRRERGQNSILLRRETDRAYVELIKTAKASGEWASRPRDLNRK